MKNQNILFETGASLGYFLFRRKAYHLAGACFLSLFLFCGSCFADVDLKIISKIESSNNPLAFNKRSKACGLFQITPISLKDYCLRHRVTLDKRKLFNPSYSLEVARWLLFVRYPQILRSKNKPVNTKNLLVCFNAGCGYVGKPLPTETRNYLIKYQKLGGVL